MNIVCLTVAAILSAIVTVVEVSQAQITPQLIEAAKKEGEVVFYGAMNVSISKRIGDLFEKNMAFPSNTGAATPPKSSTACSSKRAPEGRPSTSIWATKR